jgi:YidC/Oxa1 family membrane protein insertase
MLDSLFEFISWLLNFFYEVVPNYAVAIALLTCVVMLITTPLTLKGTRSMIEMQRFQPQIRKLQVQYKDDRQKLNEEMMAFYKEHNINPVGSCLPLLIQAPVFSILFYVVRGLTNPYKFTGLQVQLAEMGIISPSAVREGFRPKYLDHGDALYQALLGQTEMNAFGIDLSRSASTALSEGFVEAIPYFVLVGVIAGLSWVQQKQIMGRNAGAEVTQQQRTMMIIGPVMYVFFAFVSPAAIGVYFLVSTFWRVVQQYYITRSLYGHDDALGRQAQRAMAEMREEKKKEGGGAAGGKGSGGLLGGLLGNTPTDRPTKGGAAKGAAKGPASNRRSGQAPSKAAGNGSGSSRGGSSRNGSAGARGGGKNGPQDAPPARTGGGSAGGTGAPRPHSRSKKKKKRK